MKLSDVKKLEKILERTASENDAEALAAIRAATKLMRDNDVTWAKFFARMVNVVAEYEEAPDVEEAGATAGDRRAAMADSDPDPDGAPRRGGASGSRDDFSTAQLIADAMALRPDSTFVDSVARWYAEKKFITKPQRDALRNIVNGG